MQRVINFSGGKTSALMTILCYREDDIVLFCDTGREHPKTYKFIHDFEAHEKIPVTWISREGGFEGILKRRNYKTLPNRMRRFCTGDLKVDAAKQYLRSIGIQRYENLIGFRFDEQNRIRNFKEKFKKVTTKFPLNELQIGKADVNEYWKHKRYTLEIPHILGNCDLCFMKGKDAIISILASFPELADKWIADEERNNKKGHTYFPEVTIRQLRNIAQNNLFKNYKLEEIAPAFNCACTS